MIRYGLATLCVIALLLAVGYIAYLLLTTPTQIKVTDFDAYRTEALKMVREQAASLLQIGVAVLGAMWAAMIVSRENKVKWQDGPELTMFFVANVFLGGFFYFNNGYDRTLAQLYWDMGPILSSRGQFADVMNSKHVVVQYYTGHPGYGQMFALNAKQKKMGRRKISRMAAARSSLILMTAFCFFLFRAHKLKRSLKA